MSKKPNKGGRPSLAAALKMSPEERRLYKQRDAVKDMGILNRLRAHYLGDLDELNDEEERVKQRWAHVYSMLIEGKTQFHILKSVCESHGISQTTAYHDIRNAQILHGEVGREAFEGGKHVLHQQLMDLYMTAREAGDLKTAAATLKTIMELRGYNKDNTDAPDFSKLQPHQYEIGVAANVIDKLAMMIQQGGGIVQVTQLREAIEDAEIIEE